MAVHKGQLADQSSITRFQDMGRENQSSLPVGSNKFTIPVPE